MTSQLATQAAYWAQLDVDDDPLEDTLDDDEPDANMWSGWILERPHRIAVAEDDSDMRNLLVGELRRDGYEIDELPDGNALMHYLSELMDPNASTAPPDLIITDVRMPGWSGMDVLDFLHAVRWDIPVIIITAFADHATRRQAANLGAVRVLDKPFKLSDLRLTVFTALIDDDGGGEASPAGD